MSGETASPVQGRFEVGVRVDSEEPISVLLLQASSDPSSIRVSDWRLGSSLQQQIADNGEPLDCDVIIYPDGAAIQAVMLFNTPFSTEDYGVDYLVVTYEVVSSVVADTAITLSARQFLDDKTEGRENEIVTERTVLEVLPRRLVRGDVNSDATRNLTDAVIILSYLFLSGPLDCHDAGDVDDNGELQITDAIVLLTTLFGGDSTSPSDVPCRADFTVDDLPFCESTPCST